MSKRHRNPNARDLDLFGSSRAASWKARQAATGIPERSGAAEPVVVAIPPGEPYATVNAWDAAWRCILEHYDLDELPLEDFGHLWNLRRRLILFGVDLHPLYDELLQRLHSTWTYCDDGSDGGGREEADLDEGEWNEDLEYPPFDLIHYDTVMPVVVRALIHAA